MKRAARCADFFRHLAALILYLRFPEYGSVVSLKFSNSLRG